MWHKYIGASSIDDVLEVLASEKDRARIIAGGTDLILEMERGSRQGIDTLVDVTRIPGLDQIQLDEDGWIHLGPLVTHNHCVGSKLIREAAFPLAQAAWEVGSPQIRNRGTIVGNLVTASPANDTISPLVALGAELVLRSKSGERVIRLQDFYLGVRKIDLRSDEMVVDVRFPAMKPNQRGVFIKYALRKAQAIAVLNATAILTMDGDSVQSAAITLGAVAPTIIHAERAEGLITGKKLEKEIIEQAARMAAGEARPIDDIRSSAAYRQNMVRVVVKRCLSRLAESTERQGFPENPVLLRGDRRTVPSNLSAKLSLSPGTPIETTINGKKMTFTQGHGKSMLRFIREDALLTGSKEGCAEGECGACTIFLDGVAVMSCLIPAERAAGADIVTVEGLGTEEHLHPVQSAFIEDGAVQCGYCTPGFLMSAAKLLEERTSPTQEEIRQAITGNLCRCTGYYKIISAIEHAAQKANGR